MNQIPDNSSNKKNPIKMAKIEFANTPIHLRKRRKSSIPLQLVEFLRNKELNQIKPESSAKKSFKGEFSNKKIISKNVNKKKIPDLSVSSSQKKEEKFKKDKNKKDKDKKDKNKKDKKEKGRTKEKRQTNNGIENNNYYIHFIKNVYEKEPHLNKDNIVQSFSKNINESFQKFRESKHIRKRRNSALDKNFFKNNINNINLILEKEKLKQKLSNSNLNKKKSYEISSLLHIKKYEEKEKETIKLLNNSMRRSNKSRHKNKEKAKNKDKYKNNEKEKDKNNDKEKDKINDNNNEEKNENDFNKKETDNINNESKMEKKDLLDSENKKETNNNTENATTKKRNKLKKLWCCFISNGDSSIEND